MTGLIGEGISLPEGPAFLDDGSLCVTELALERGCVTRIAPDGTRGSVIAKTGRPNGLALGTDAVLWVAESLVPAILRLELDGRSAVIATHCGGTPLLWPNDLCVGPDGRLYVTDSGIRFIDFIQNGELRVDPFTIDLDGRIVAIDPVSGDGRIIDRGLRFANGIAFGPDGLLYATETITGNIYRYDLSKAASRELFGNVLNTSRPIMGIGGPDGIAFDANGNLYVAVFGLGEIAVLDRSGAVARRIPTRGREPTNVVFGPQGSTAIYVTDCEHGCVEVIDVGIGGLALQR